jgi:hypothetical protein
MRQAARRSEDGQDVPQGASRDEIWLDSSGLSYQQCDESRRCARNTTPNTINAASEIPLPACAWAYPQTPR